MKSSICPFAIAGCFVLLIALPPCHPVTLTSSEEDSSSSSEDEQLLLRAGLSSDGPALLAFFHARSRTDIEREHLQQLLRQLADGPQPERHQATAQLLGLGPLALPLLRQTANDLDHPSLAACAADCLPWLEGPDSNKLLAAAARTLAQRKPPGAAAALLAYLPLALDADVLAAVNAALIAVAAPEGKPDAALVRGLADPLAVRRAAAGVALCRASPPDQVPEVRKLLKDPAPGVRLRAAMALAEAHDAEAIPVLIDLLADLEAVKREPVEELLTQLAGEWAPLVRFPSDDKIARKIRRDAWLAWWNNTNGQALLAALAEHTLTPQRRQKVRQLLSLLGSDDFGKRENATRELFRTGRIALPQLREAAKDRDMEVARRAKLLVERIEREPAHRLPLATLRLLGVRKPEGAAAALLGYLPHAEEETQSDEVRKALTALASRDGKAEPALVDALSDERAQVRATAAEALASGGGVAGRAEARKLLRDASSSVRLKAALALARAREKEAVPVLIGLLTALSAEEVGQAEDALYQLAGDSAPKETAGEEAAQRKKYQAAWSDWWKANGQRVDLTRLTDRTWYGYTLICDANRVYELDRHGKERWTLDVPQPIDAVVVARDRVLVAEWNGNRVTERDLKNNIVWQKRVGSNPTNVQRLPNGNTFIATTNAGLVEVDRTGKEVYAINKLPTNVVAAYRSPRGPVVCLLGNGQCVLMDTTGKELRSFACPGGGAGCIDVLPNGGLLVVRQNKVAEYDSEGKKLRELDAVNPTTPSGLPNGHVLVSSQGGSRVVELDRAGKVVWEHNGQACYRARPR